MEAPIYEGSFSVDELIYWINAMDKYLYYEDVEKEKRVIYIVIGLKVHATLWWDEV